MFMAKITGSVVSTKKEDSLTGKKLMIVQPVDANGEHVRSEEV
ncbi:EutN/CcmL family microcompartment protein, partial [Listeria monocytogenes]